MKRFGIIAMVLVLLSACQEEIWNNQKFETGLPAAFDIDINVPSAKKLVVTRGINDYESEINELILFFALGDNIQHAIDLTGNLVSKSVNEDGKRTYSLKTPVTEDINGNPILSGNYKVYAVANWSSPFSNIGEEIYEIKSVNSLKALAVQNTGFVLSLSGSERFPMSGEMAETANLLPMESSNPDTQTAPDGNKLTGITLYRLTSHIEFEFKNGQKTNSDGTQENPKFTPTSYSVYNIPGSANLMSASTDAGNILDYDADNYSAYKDIKVAGSSIAFFMLENEQAAGTNNTYAERDAWTRPSGVTGEVSHEDKNFIYAPKGSTFIVVNGEYSGTTYFGNVSYTIHLGRIGSGNNYNPKDFSVGRNEYHKYTVTINGAESVMTESETDGGNGGTNPGVEGTLTEISKGVQFVLDSHYESIMLSFPLDEKCAKPSMIINTPYNEIKRYELVSASGNADELVAYPGYQTEKADYKWIHFMKPTSKNQLPKYNSGETCLIDELAAELKAAYEAKQNGQTPVGDHILVENGQVYVTAFVDEYFYETAPDGSATDWTVFANTDNRYIMLNPDVSVSTDGNSTWYPDYIFSIAQRSIKTTYNLDNPNINAFGIETWNETGQLSFATNAHTYNQTKDYDVTLTDGDGWANTRALWLESSTITGSSWTKGNWVGVDAFGYTAAVSDNLKGSHVYTGAGVDDLNAFNACLTRNRDEDGDGKIDEDEIKWYLPALEQYTSIWLADEYLTEDTRLFDPATQSYTANDIMFFTSSSFGRRLYYAAEGASYGKVEDASWASAEQSVRCVRSLKDTKAAPTPTSENDQDNRIITVSGASDQTLRTQIMSGEYTKGHYERSADNRLPKAFQVATYILGENIPIDSDDPEITWLTALSSGGASITRSGSGSNYTYTITVNFNSQSGITYSVDGTTLNPGSNGRCSYSFTVTGGRSLSSTTRAIAIKATKDGVTNTVTANVTYSWTSSMWGNGSGSATVSYANNKTGGSSASIKTGRGDGVMDKYSLAQLKTSSTLCAATYYEEADGSDLGQWRVPNQRELMLMAQWDYFPEAKHPDLDGISAANAVYFTSSTFYTNDNGNNNFTYIKNGFTREGSSTMYIRCVRDAEVIGGGSGDDTGGNTGGSGGDNTGGGGEEGGEL